MPFKGFAPIDSVTGAVPIAYGGTNATSFGVNSLCVFNGTKLLPIPHLFVGAVANYNILATDFIIEKTSTLGASDTLTLLDPATVGLGKIYIIKDATGAAYTTNFSVITAAGNIDGAASFVFNANYQQASFFSNGVNWRVCLGSTGLSPKFTDITTTGTYFSLGTIRSQATGNILRVRSEQYSSDTVGSNIALLKSRNDTVGSHTALLNGDNIGVLYFYGSDGTTFRDACYIKGVVGGAVGSGAGQVPGRLEFWTRPGGGGAASARMIIYPDGRILAEDRFNLSNGVDVVAAGDLTLSATGNTFVISGNTNINAITTTNWSVGAEVNLVFTGTPTINHDIIGGANTAQILLQNGANLTISKNPTVLRLVYLGSTINKWCQISPISANQA